MTAVHPSVAGGGHQAQPCHSHWETRGPWVLSLRSSRWFAQETLDHALGGRAIIGVMTTRSDRQLLTIGEFAYQARLTRKALRIYDEIGLLRPTEVDPWNGHRRYQASQLRQARLIGMLRGVDMSLAEIGLLLADLDVDHQLASTRLERYLVL